MIFRPGLGFAGASQPPRGSPEVPTHSGPAAGSDQGSPQSLPMAQLPLSPPVLPCPSPCSGAERWDSRSCQGAGTHSHSHTHSLPLPTPRAPAAAPAPWQLPRGPGCAWDPPSWPHISCQVFSKKYSRAMQGGSWGPLALSSLSIPPGTAVTCPRGDPPGASLGPSPCASAAAAAP